MTGAEILKLLDAIDDYILVEITDGYHHHFLEVNKQSVANWAYGRCNIETHFALYNYTGRWELRVDYERINSRP